MEVPNLDEYLAPYRELEDKLAALKPTDDPATLLVKFPLAKVGDAPIYGKITCEYNELTAYCPWTSFPDQGSLKLAYVPNKSLLELKSFKYYLLAFRDRHITQEHLAQKIHSDIRNLLFPVSISVVLDYMPRGGLHTVFKLGVE